LVHPLHVAVTDICYLQFRVTDRGSTLSGEELRHSAADPRRIVRQLRMREGVLSLPRH
jgi:hypothetical protein